VRIRSKACSIASAPEFRRSRSRQKKKPAWPTGTSRKTCSSRSLVVRGLVPVAAARVLPADPVRAVGAVLALPDRNAMFDAIDQGAASAKSLVAMRGAGGANHRQVADDERA